MDKKGRRTPTYTIEPSLFVCYRCGTLESPLPLNPGQGSDSPCKIAATRSISVRGQRCHVPYPRWPVQKRHVQSRGSVAPMILPPRAWGNWWCKEEPDLPSTITICGLLALGKAKHTSGLEFVRATSFSFEIYFWRSILLHLRSNFGATYY